MIEAGGVIRGIGGGLRGVASGVGKGIARASPESRVVGKAKVLTKPKAIGGSRELLNARRAEVFTEGLPRKENEALGNNYAVQDAFDLANVRNQLASFNSFPQEINHRPFDNQIESLDSPNAFGVALKLFRFLLKFIAFSLETGETRTDMLQDIAEEARRQRTAIGVFFS
jgi:hypothetical protein